MDDAPRNGGGLPPAIGIAIPPQTGEPLASGKERRPGGGVAWMIAAIALLAGGVQPVLFAQAEEATLVVVDGVPVDPNGRMSPDLVARMMRGVPGGSNAAPDPSEARLQQLLQLRVDRRPENLLQVMAKQFGAASPSTNEVERFRNDVTTGNWPAVAQFLASLPTNQAAQVYDHLLNQFLTLPGQGGPGEGSQGPLPFGGAGMPAAPGVPPPSHFLVVGDVLALANACPGDLTDSALQKLGQLLSRATPGQGGVAPLVAILDAGAGRLGGPQPGGRYAAAKLLIAGGRLVDAGRFLPPLDLSATPPDFTVLDLHASLLAAQAREPSRQGDPAGEERKAMLERAWTISQLLLQETNCPPRERDAALGRALELLPRMSRELGSNWLRENFVSRPAQGASLFAQVGGRVARGASERQASVRERNLRQQKQAVDALLLAAPDPGPWRSMLETLAAGWAREAEFTRTRPSMAPNFMAQQFDPYGNPVYLGPQQRFQDPNQPEPVAAADLVETSPHGAWLACMEAPLAGRIRVLRLQMLLKASKFDEALPVIEDLARQDVSLGRNLSLELLNAWAEAREPNRQQAFYGPRYYNPYMAQGAEGIPLTRARQERNLDELARLLDRLRRLPGDGPDAAVVVSVFTRAHSNAEVFRVEDIERVFGPIGEVRPVILSELLQTMRTRLASQWRQPRVQQDARTKRNDKEISAEVRRGYQLVTRLAEGALAQRPADWRLTLAHAASLYDWAEFEYGQKVDLAIYTSRRDEAFGEFEKAARLYSTEIATPSATEPSARVYQQWFNATLGASDLAYLTRQTEPGTNQLGRIRQAMLSLPGEAPDRHLRLFAKELAEAGVGLKPELKPRYLRSGLEIVGALDEAREARELVRHYDDLLGEIVLEARVDGDTTVGHGRPFGVFVGILHTEAVGREAGGFARYLQNQGSMGYYFYNPSGGGPVNYRDEFEKQVREKYADGFEVLTVTFHEDKVQPRGTDRPGWRVFPYAYLLLKAKDSSVDRLPSLQLSMDFADTRGQVSLPVASAPVLIDARPETPPARPVREIEVLQVLDDRNLAKAGHAIALEIKATARGLVPELGEVLDMQIPGFRTTRVDDRGLSLTQMDVDANELAPVSERVWLVTLQPESSTRAPTSFLFPRPKRDPIKLTFKRYADADLSEVPAEVAMAGLPLRRDYGWAWVFGGVGLGVLVFAGWRRRRPKTGETPAAARYALPPEITPFSVIHLLEQLEGDPSLRLSPGQRHELTAEVSDLQRRFFDRPGQANRAPDLKSVAERWINAVQ